MKSEIKYKFQREMRGRKSEVGSWKLEMRSRKTLLRFELDFISGVSLREL